MWDNLTVNGFHFETAAEYADAKKEYEAIDYICSKMDVTNPETAFKVYYKLLERKNLHTIVGYSFLKDLRDRIVTSGIISENELRSINAPKVSVRSEKDNTVGDETSLEIDSLTTAAASGDQAVSSIAGSKNNSKEKKLKAVADYYRYKTKKCHIIIAALAIVIIVIFAITYYKGGLDLTDSEIIVQNKYSAWAEELAEKEAKLEIRARELDEKEIELNQRELGIPISGIGNLR